MALPNVVGLNQSTASLIGIKGRERKNSLPLPHCFQAVTLDFSCPWTQTQMNYIVGSPGFGLLSLRDYVRQFIRGKYIYVYIHSIGLLLVCFSGDP